MPYLLLCRENSPQREYDLRAGFDAVRWIAETGSPRRWMPNDLPPRHAVYQQMCRWLDAGCFERLVEDVRPLLREWAGRKEQPTAVCIGGMYRQPNAPVHPRVGGARRPGFPQTKTRLWSPRLGWSDAAQRQQIHIAVGALGHPLALKIIAAEEGDRAQIAALAEQVQHATGNSVELAYVDQGYTGPVAAEAAEQRASGSKR